MSTRSPRRAPRRPLGFAMSVVLATAVLVAVPTAAEAAGAPIATGTIVSDSNADGVRTATGVAGTDDRGIAGVPVQLVCVATGDVLGSVLTAADGAYELGDGDLTTPLADCAGDVALRIDTTSFADGIYAAQVASGDNDFARQTPSVALTAPFSAAPGTPVALDGLLAPAWRSDLALVNDPGGWNGQAVRTGSAPWDADESEPGWDGGADNGVVRAGDTVAYTFSAAFASDDPLGDAASSAVLEQTIVLTAGAVVNFARIPAACIGTDAPASAIIANPSGTVIPGSSIPPAGTTSITLRCNLGEIGETRSALQPSTSVWVSNTSTNGATFSTTARLYGVAPDGTTTIRPSGEVQNGPVEITSQPRYDLRKGNYTVSAATTATINGTPTAGYYLYYHVGITTDRRTGVEAFQQPLTISEDFFAQYNLAGSAGPIGSTVSGLEWYLTQCIPSPVGSTQANWVHGTRNATNAAYSASNSGNCAIARDAANTTSPYTLTLSGIDTTGVHYPTQTVGGASLTSGPYWVASYRLQIFVPMSEIDRAVGGMDGAGSLSFSNLVGDFDPDGMSGASNYGSGYEPGYCVDGTPSTPPTPLVLNCDLMENGSRSNNIPDPVSITISPGTWAKYNFHLPVAWAVNAAQLPGGTTSHDGAATLQPGQFGASDIRLTNGGAAPMTGIMMCDVFDGTTMRLSTLDNVVDTNTPLATLGSDYDLSARHAYVMWSNHTNNNNATTGWPAALAYQQNWRIEYARFDLSGDNPIGGGFNATYNRFEGTWTAQRAASCADGAAENLTGWQTSVAAAGGIDAVNAVRVVAINGYGLESATAAYFRIAYEQRDTFNGGPQAGQMIPAGTVAANFARVRSDSYAAGWSGRAYIPMSAAGENGNSDGDRWTVTRASMSLAKRTITVDGVGTGAADFGNTGVTLAGGQVVWEITSAITAEAQNPAPVQNVVITDTLPRYAIYNEQCTAGLTGGTPATSYTVNGDGTTTLVWNLGALVPNQPVPSRIICTDTDPLAPNGATLTNVAVITSPGVTPVSAHRDDHTVILEQTGELRLRKDVDQTLDLADDEQHYTLRVKNFSDSLPVQRPVVIDVLSNNGDGTSTAGVNRSPASDFAGTSGLTGPIAAFDWSETTPVPGTVYYTTIASGSIPQNLNADTDPSIWQTEAQIGGAWSTVTGFKFEAANDLATASSGDASGLVLRYATSQAGNDPGDLYANRFTAFSESFRNGPVFQLLTSNQTTVRVIGFSLGDFIWIDRDDDGVYAAGTDTPAPEGVTVQVFRGDGTLVTSTLTDAAGRWIVNDLARGDYYVVVPASQFADGALLAGLAAASVNSIPDPGGDLNEDADHHAIDFAGGVRSAGVLNLDATVAGSTITGQEPMGDNVGALRVSPGTTDDFTNLTLDLALGQRQVSPATGGGTGGLLGGTGVSIPWTIPVVAVMMLVAGALVLTLRRREQGETRADSTP